MHLERIDHVHIFVKDREASERWYAETLDFHRYPDLEFWVDQGGPLILADSDGAIKLALFEGSPTERDSVVAFATSAKGFLSWRDRLSEKLTVSVDPVDHGASWSLYFKDPDGNPFEITSYQYEAIAAQLSETNT